MVGIGETDDEVLYLLAELRQEATYARHHVQKIAAFFAAMERFAQTLREAGHRVLHLDLDDTADFGDLPALLCHLCAETGAQRFEYQRPDEYRLLSQLESFCDGLEIGSAPARSHHFLVPFATLDDYFPSGRQQRMETFYRRVRRETGWLMDGDGKPEGGQWNYDVENRKALPKAVSPPPPLLFENDVSAVLERIGRHLGARARP